MHTEINILEMTPPAGFEPHFRHSPLTDPWEPLYSKRTAHAVILGMYVGNAHVNARGIAHGGLISALADNAMGLSCAIQFPESPGLLTVNLNVDYMGVAKIGQWLEFDTTFTKAGASLCFAQLFVTADASVCAKASATFKAMRRQA